MVQALTPTPPARPTSSGFTRETSGQFVFGHGQDQSESSSDDPMKSLTYHDLQIHIDRSVISDTKLEDESFERRIYDSLPTA